MHLAREPYRKHMAPSEVDRLVGLCTDRCRVEMFILLIRGVEAAETWDLHAQEKMLMRAEGESRRGSVRHVPTL